jgi:hypothetical protein
LPDGRIAIVQWPYDPYAIKVVLTNVSKKTFRFKYHTDPRSSLDFVVRKDAATVSVRKKIATLFSPSDEEFKTIVLAPGKSHTFNFSVSFVIEEKYQGPGSYRVWAFFNYGDIDIYSQPYTLVVPRLKQGKGD